MAALAFLAPWLALCAYLSFKVPRWLGMRRFAWPVTAILLPIMFAGPIYDEFLGMRQFEKLCAQRAVITVSPLASHVVRAGEASLPTAELPGYWITIRSQPVTYIDLDTGLPFLWYEGLHTKGGRIGRLTLMGGTRSCWPKDSTEILSRLQIDKLLNKGKKP